MNNSARDRINYLPLTEIEFRAEYAARPGLIPMQLDAQRRIAQWVDLGRYHCYEGSFRRSLATYTAILAGARHPSQPWRCESSLDFLGSHDLAADCIPPAGFICHAGRCGSTLLARALARSEDHLVFGEGGPHNQIWRVIDGRRESGPALFRNLVLHTGRRRLASYRAHLVKLTSFNITRLDTIQAAFPEVPVLFLFRRPAEILASYRRAMPEWMGRDPGVGATWHSPEAAVADFFRAALLAGEKVTCLDYADLAPETLPSILRFFRLSPSAGDLKLMRDEFRWDAKANGKWSPRPSMDEGAESSVSCDLQGMYEELRARSAFKW
jgi:hypothetical protein